MFVLLILCILLGFACPEPALAELNVGTQLELPVADWAWEVRDEGDYDLNLDDAFPKGIRAYAYLELRGFGVGQDEGIHYLDLSVDVALKTKGGFKLFSQVGVLEFEKWYIEDPNQFWFYIWVDIPKWAPRGVYRTEITINDRLSGESLVEEKLIRVF